MCLQWQKQFIKISLQNSTYIEDRDRKTGAYLQVLKSKLNIQDTDATHTVIAQLLEQIFVGVWLDFIFSSNVPIEPCSMVAKLWGEFRDCDAPPAPPVLTLCSPTILVGLVWVPPGRVDLWPSSLLFSFLLLVKLTESAKVRFNKYNSKLLSVLLMQNPSLLKCSLL